MSFTVMNISQCISSFTDAACLAATNGNSILNPCIIPSKVEKMMEIFTSFAEKYNDYGNCTNKDDAIKCVKNDNYGRESINFGQMYDTDGAAQQFLIRLMNRANDRRECNQVSAGQTTCRICSWSGPAVGCKSYVNDDNTLYECLGYKELSTDEELYKLGVFKNGSCIESYTSDISNSPTVVSSCEKALRLYKEFLNGTNSSEIQPDQSDQSHISSLLKANTLFTAAGAASTLFCGYKTAVELQKIWTAYQQSEEQAKLNPVDYSKMRAAIYAVATAASLGFSFISYSAEGN